MIGLPKPSNLIVAAQDRIGDELRHSLKYMKAGDEAATAQKEWWRLRREVANWAFLARIHGGEAVNIYEQVKQKYEEALQKMRNTDNALEKIKHPLPPMPKGLKDYTS